MQHPNFYIIAGPNGAGKTTLMKMMSLLVLFQNYHQMVVLYGVHLIIPKLILMFYAFGE